MSEARDAKYWHAAPVEDAPGIVWRHLQALAQGYRAEILRRQAALTYLYERESYFFAGLASTISSAGPPKKWLQESGLGWMADDFVASMNALKSTIDMVGGRLFSEIPAIEVAPYNTTYEITEAAKRKSDALNGTMNPPAAKVPLVRPGWTGLKLGFGAHEPVVERGALRFDKVRYRDLWWDPEDAEDGDPQGMHRTMRVSRSRLLAKIEAWDGLPRKKEIIRAIKELPEADPYGPLGAQVGTWASPYQRLMAESRFDSRQADQLWLVRSIELPGGPGSGDGRYLMTVHGSPRSVGGRPVVSDVVMWDGGWTRQTFPWCHWTPTPHEDGLEGIGLGHLLEPYQRQLDHSWTVADRQLKTIGYTKMLVQAGAIKNLTDIAALGFAVVPVDGAMQGKPYEIVPHDPGNDVHLRTVEMVRAVMREEVGVNPMAAVGASRLGANASGRALMEEDARQDDRLAPIDDQFTAFLIRTAHEVLNALDDAADRDKSFEISWMGRDGQPHRRKWAELSMPAESYSLTLEPVGILGRRKAGRIQKLIEMGQQDPSIAPLITEELNRSADVRRLTEIANAGPDLVEWQLDLLSDPNADHSKAYPGESTPLDLAIARGEARLQIAERKRAEPDTIDRLLTYVQTAKDKLAEKPKPTPLGASPAPMPTDPLMGAAPMPMDPAASLDLAALPPNGGLQQ